MLVSRSRKQQIVDQVDKKVREKFCYGSYNKPEDCFDPKKKGLALINSENEETEGEVSREVNAYVAGKKISVELNIFLKMLAYARKISGGNCAFQASWAMAQMIQMDVYPVHLADVVDDENRNTHMLIILGDPINDPDNAMIYDPHGFESLYPYKEFFIGGHHANRYGQKIVTFLSKTISFDENTMSDWLGQKTEKIIVSFDSEDKDSSVDLRTRDYWITKTKEHEKAGKKASSENNWNIALIEFRAAMTISINLYGEKHPRLLPVYNDVLDALYNTKQYNEAYELATQFVLKNISPRQEFLFNKHEILRCKMIFGRICAAVDLQTKAKIYFESVIVSSSRMPNDKAADTYLEQAKKALTDLGNNQVSKVTPFVPV